MKKCPGHSCLVCDPGSQKKEALRRSPHRIPSGSSRKMSKNTALIATDFTKVKSTFFWWQPDPTFLSYLGALQPPAKVGNQVPVL